MDEDLKRVLNKSVDDFKKGDMLYLNLPSEPRDLIVKYINEKLPHIHYQ